MMVSSGGGRVTDDLFQRVLSDSLREFVDILKTAERRAQTLLAISGVVETR